MGWRVGWRPTSCAIAPAAAGFPRGGRPAEMCAGTGGVKHEYVRVVEAYREHGKTRHRTVLNLGRRDLLASHLDLNKLMRLLHGDAAPDGRVRREDVHAVAAWDWGPMLAAGHIWRELGLEATLDRLTRPGRSDAT